MTLTTTRKGSKMKVSLKHYLTALVANEGFMGLQDTEGNLYDLVEFDPSKNHSSLQLFSKDNMKSYSCSFEFRTTFNTDLQIDPMGYVGIDITNHFLGDNLEVVVKRFIPAFKVLGSTHFDNLKGLGF